MRFHSLFFKRHVSHLMEFILNNVSMAEATILTYLLNWPNCSLVKLIPKLCLEVIIITNSVQSVDMDQNTWMKTNATFGRVQNGTTNRYTKQAGQKERLMMNDRRINHPNR